MINNNEEIEFKKVQLLERIKYLSNKMDDIELEINKLNDQLDKLSDIDKK